MERFIKDLEDKLTDPGTTPDVRDGIKALLSVHSTLYNEHTAETEKKLSAKIKNSLLAFLNELSKEIQDDREVVYLEEGKEKDRNFLNAFIRLNATPATAKDR